MLRRNVIRARRCVALLAAAVLLLPFTIILLAVDQQYNLTYTSRQVFYQESDFYKINTTQNVFTEAQAPLLLTQYLYENSSSGETLLPREKFMEVNARMKSRREHLKEQCWRLGLSSSALKANAWEYLINRQHHIIWCNIFKAASTSWMYNFNLMANYSAAFLNRTKEVPLQLARKRYARPSLEMIRKAQLDSITFFIVRHPLERLASAYGDKILHALPRTHHDELGRKIIRKYRKSFANLKTISGRFSGKPKFEEFVEYILDEVKANRSLDMHWTPYTSFCTPCRIHVDVILKFETLDEDQRYLIQLANLQEVVRPEWRNSGQKSRVDKLFSRLRKDQLNRLTHLYRYDLQLFNYSTHDYYNMLQKTNR